MTLYPRIRKTIKWGAAAVTALLALVWIAGEFWSFGWGGPPGRAVYFSGGLLLWGKAYVFADGRGWGIDSPLPLPLWLPMVATLLPTAFVWWLDALARRRVRVNLCPSCDYDRTGLADGAKCPECGATPAK